MTTDTSDDLVSFLQGNVDDSNISVPFDTSSDIDHADYDGPNDYPQIAVVSEDSTPQGGGQTGFSATQGDGSGPVQEVVVSVLVDCWGGPPDRSVYQTAGVHPDKVAAELADEVWSVCIDANQADAPSGYEWISAGPPNDADDVERDPTHYRQQVVCRLKYRHTT